MKFVCSPFNFIVQQSFFLISCSFILLRYGDTVDWMFQVNFKQAKAIRFHVWYSVKKGRPGCGVLETVSQDQTFWRISHDQYRVPLSYHLQTCSLFVLETSQSLYHQQLSNGFNRISTYQYLSQLHSLEAKVTLFIVGENSRCNVT